MTPRWYGTVATLVAVAAVSGCADSSQVAATQPPASIAAPTALSRPSGGPLNVVATAPAPPPTAVPASAAAPASAPPASDPPAPPVSGPPEPTVAPDPTGSAVAGPPGGDKPGPNGQLYSQHAAELTAQADSALVHLPSGASLQRTPVPSLLTQTAEGMGTSTGKDDHWWIVPGKVVEAMAFIKQHPPTGMTSAGSSGAADGTGESTLDFDFGPTSHQPATMLGVSFVQDGDHVAIRVQAQVAYIPTRTAIESIPPSVTSGTAVYQPPNQMLPDKVTREPRRAATLSAADVRVIADAFNGLDAHPTGFVHSCPAPNGEEAWFTFAYGGHTVVFHVEPNGCGGVLVAADGVAQPELSLDDAVYTGMEKALHVTKAENPFLSAVK